MCGDKARRASRGMWNLGDLGKKFPHIILRTVESLRNVVIGIIMGRGSRCRHGENFILERSFG